MVHSCVVHLCLVLSFQFYVIVRFSGFSLFTFGAVAKVIWFFSMFQLLLRFTQQNSYCISISKTKHKKNWIENQTSPDLGMIIGSACLFIS
jgi:hypothetical protein